MKTLMWLVALALMTVALPSIAHAKPVTTEDLLKAWQPHSRCTHPVAFPYTFLSGSSLEPTFPIFGRGFWHYRRLYDRLVD